MSDIRTLDCPVCGFRREQSDNDCQACGSPMSNHRAGKDLPPLTWNAKLSLFRNAIVVRQLALVLGIPVVFLFLFLLVLEWPPDGAKLGQLAGIALLVAGILLVLLLLTLGLIYGGRYELQYRLDAQGIESKPIGRTSRKNRVINLLLIFSGRPSAMGAGLLAQSRQNEYVTWTQVDTVTAQRGDRSLVLRKGKRPLMVVACNEEDFERVLRLAQEAVTRAKSDRSRNAI